MDLESTAGLLATLLDASIRSLAVALAVGLVLSVARIRSHSVLHNVWAGVLAAMLTMPMLAWLAPSVALPLPLKAQEPTPLRPERAPSALAPPVTVHEQQRSNFEALPSAPESASKAVSKKPVSWAVVALAIYLAGLVTLVLRMSWGWLVMRRLVRSSRPAASESGWTFWECGAVSTPLTCGVFRARTILPLGWREWPEAKLEAVLVHEQAHVNRRDPLLRFLSGLNCAVFWFHPLAWWLDRKLAAAAELACDDLVIQRTARPADYAAVLVEIARDVHRRGARLSLDGIGLLGKGSLEQRVDRLLKGATPQVVSRSRCIAIVLLCLGATCLAVTARPRRTPAIAESTPGPASSESTPQPAPIQEVFQAASQTQKPTDGDNKSPNPTEPNGAAGKRDDGIRLEFGTIQGQLLATSGISVPAAGVEIVLTPIDGPGAEMPISIGKTDSAGRYRLENVPPGRFRVIARWSDFELLRFVRIAAPGGAAASDEWQIVTITAGHTIANVNFNFSMDNLLVPPAKSDTLSLIAAAIQGNIRVDDDSPLPDWVLIGINGNSQTPYPDVRPPAGGKTKTLKLATELGQGDNFISAERLPAGFYVKSMTFGNVDLMRAPLVLSAIKQPALSDLRTAADAVEIVLTKTPPPGMPRGVTISGRVTHMDLPLYPNMVIELADMGPATAGRAKRTGVSPNPRDGTFEIPGVPPGRYTLQAVDRIEARAAGVLGEFQSEPMAIDVAGRNIANLELRFDFMPVPKALSVLNPALLRSIRGFVEGIEGGALPAFTVRFAPNAKAPSLFSEFANVRFSQGIGSPLDSPSRAFGRAFIVSMGEGEYHAEIYGLPSGYAVESVTCGPLDLTKPFFVTKNGIADRLGNAPVPNTVTIRLQATASSRP